MTSRRPTISVAMATYNGEKFLREQLDSIAAQTFLPIELQIGDDGSTDRTEEIVREFAATAPFPVSFHRNGQTLGYGENFLQTATRCSGDWIAFCDQDDIWLTTKLDRCTDIIAQSPDNLRLVAHEAELINDRGQPLGRVLYGAGMLRRGRTRRLERPGAFICAGLLQLFHADLVRSISLWPRASTPHPPEPDRPAMIRYPHDGWVPLLANVTGEVHVIPDVLIKYRRHEATVTELRSDSASRRAQIAIGDNSERYAELADWYRKSAEILREHSRRAAPEWAGLLEEGSKKFDCEASDLELRHRLYRENSIAGRFEVLASLVRSGAYQRRWTLSPRSFLKDVVRAGLGA